MMARAAVLALLAAGATIEPAAPEPCSAASAALPAAAGVSAEEREVVEDYRTAWRRACDPGKAAADLGALFGDAEALTADVGTSRVLEALAAALAAERGARWPLPGIMREESAPLEVDWGAFGAVVDRGTAEDGKFWRGAALVAGRGGKAAWLGEPISGGLGRCVRLGEVRWAELAEALDQMEQARSEPYVRHARALRAGLTETLAAIALGPETCACLPGDPAAGLESLVAAVGAERLGTPARRALAKAAEDALAALRLRRVRVRVLRAAPDAPPTGCGGPR